MSVSVFVTKVEVLTKEVYIALWRMNTENQLHLKASRP